MGLFKKLKEILYDEEEPTEQIRITPEMRNEATPMREEVKKEVKVEPIVKPISTPVKEEEKVDPVSERELFNTNKNFPFMDFDEEEFEEQRPSLKQNQKEVVTETSTQVRRPNNVFEYEKRKKVERHTDMGHYEKTVVTETVETKRFKPSPIISPVYGILDKNYSSDDIVEREGSEKVDIKTVRDKAFGDSLTPVSHNDDEDVKVINDNHKNVIYEEEEAVTISEPEEVKKKVKTIDELLEDTSDIEVDANDNDIEYRIGEENVENNNDIKDISETSEPTQEMKMPSDDTLESDLFDLIDSMYDKKEDNE